MAKNTIPKKYWYGEGRRIIVIPPQILKKQRSSGGLFSGLYLTDIGYYPDAQGHYTYRKKGSAENILIYCTKGKGWVTIFGQKHEVTANTFFVLPQFIAHEYVADDESPWTLYWIKFGGDGLPGLNSLSFTKQSFTPKVFTFKNDATELFEQMFLILQQGYSTQYLVYVNMLLINLLTLFFFQRESMIQKEITNPHDLIVQKAIEHMKLNLNTPITIDELTKVCGCSISKLSNIFKLNTTHSLIDYYNHLRIQNACQELCSSNKLIKEIASELGFKDQYYFSRLFAKVMGVSPHQYRMQNIAK